MHKYPLFDESLAEKYTVESSLLTVASAKFILTNNPFVCIDPTLEPSFAFNLTKSIILIVKLPRLRFAELLII